MTLRGDPAERVLVLMPTRRDAERTVLFLAESDVSEGGAVITH